jgi:hypothetical protein
MFKPEAVDGYVVEFLSSDEAVIYNPVSRLSVPTTAEIGHLLNACSGSHSLEDLARLLGTTVEATQANIDFLAGEELLTQQDAPAIKPNLMISELGKEVIVYDSERQQAFCLSEAASIVFQHCQHGKELSQAESALMETSGEQAATVLGATLDELENNGLIERSARSKRSRRDFLATAAAIAAAAPVLMSITAPRPTMAISGCVPAAQCAIGANCGKVCDPGCVGPPRCQTCNVSMSSGSLVFTANLNNTCCDPTTFPNPVFFQDCNSICGVGAGSYCCCNNPINGSQMAGGPCTFCGVDQNRMCIGNNCVGGVCV